ncbi:MAG: hypothetical protein ACRD4A_02350 [Candidatus Acidiferrales bacterium]
MQNTISLREQIPALTLRTPDGRTVSAWDFKQKKNRVIALLRADSPGTREFVNQIAAHAEDWKQKEAIGLVVFSKPPAAGMPENLPAEIITGTDASGRSIVRYLGTEALGPGGLVRQGVFVADRYGELYAQWIVEKDGELPRMSAILKALEQVEVACEECQVSVWPIEG